MKKPFILTVDDDPIVLESVRRDMQKRYARNYQIIAINLGTAALKQLEKIQQAGEQVALLIVDQRMPQMTGVEFLSQARLLFPAARRVLLTAYADTEASIAAINEVGLDYYMMKPWDPPEENLYPVVDDLLHDWRALLFPPGKR